MIPQSAPDSLPSRVIFELIELCNFACTHCFVPHRMKGPTTAEATAIAQRLAAAEVPSISWTGGEPYLRRDLLEIAAAAAGPQTVQTVNTNGSKITPGLARASAGVFALARVSLFGIPASYRANTLRAGADGFSQAMDAIGHFLDAGVRVQVNIPVISADVGEVDQIAEAVAARFGRDIEEAVLIPVIKVGPVEHSAIAFPTVEAVAPVAVRLSETMPFAVRLFEWATGKHMLIKADGKAYAHPIEGAEDGIAFLGDPAVEELAAIWSRFPTEFLPAHRALTPSVDHLRTA